jgi:hypothetical protein
MSCRIDTNKSVGTGGRAAGIRRSEFGSELWPDMEVEERFYKLTALCVWMPANGFELGGDRTVIDDCMQTRSALEPLYGTLQAESSGGLEFGVWSYEVNCLAGSQAYSACRIAQCSAYGEFRFKPSHDFGRIFAFGRKSRNSK